MQKSNPFAEPLLIAFLSVVFGILLLAALVVWRMNAPSPKEVSEIAMYAGLFATFTTMGGALAQALSRDPATARMNAAAAVTNASTLAAATPNAPPAAPAAVEEARPETPPPPPPDRPGGPT